MNHPTLPSDQLFVAYYRVSTVSQGESGLGLEAQQNAVAGYLSALPSPIVLEHFTEIESGKRKDRPELTKAIALCKRKKATLIIAKLDRLARNVHFISGLMESRVEFLACDNPYANRLMVHMLAAFAEHEREMISQRTKDGLRAAKARGTVLGRNGKVLGAENRSRADHHALSIVDQVVAIPSSDRQNVSALTLQMNSHQIPTMKGGRWHRQSVYRLLDRFLEARSDGAAVIDYVRVFGRSKWHALKNSFERSLSKNAASGI